MLSTWSGWKGKTEIVHLQYDPKVISYAALCARAKELGACAIAFPEGDAELEAAREVFGDQARVSDEALRRVEDTKYYLLKDPVRFVPMTEQQATHLNAMDEPRDYSQVLSPRQIDALATVRAHPKADWTLALGESMSVAWKRFSAVLVETSATPEIPSGG